MTCKSNLNRTRRSPMAGLRHAQIVVVMILILGLASVIFSQESLANRAVMGEIRAVSNVKVDGQLSEWRGFSQININSAAQCISGANRWKGSADLSGRIMLAYSASHLYIAGEIRDDKLINDQKGILMWNGDCVQVFIDTDLDGDYDTTVYNADDFSFGISPGTDGKAPEWTIWQPAGKQIGTILGTSLGLVRTSEGYNFELAIPLEHIGLRPTPGKSFGMGIILIDSDEPGVVKSQLANVPANAWRDPTLFAKVTFR
ncbi:MAG TPA: hypothetical protein DD782_00865 [Firmicutes bacterium]|nr:hypothetical protein [Bacillota bacterium]